MAKNKETGGRVSKETRLALLNLPSDGHRPRAIAGEGAQVFAREPSRCRQRQHCARQTLARASLENSRTPLPGNVPPYFLATYHRVGEPGQTTFLRPRRAATAPIFPALGPILGPLSIQSSVDKLDNEMGNENRPQEWPQNAPSWATIGQLLQQVARFEPPATEHWLGQPLFKAA